MSFDTKDRIGGLAALAGVHNGGFYRTAVPYVKRVPVYPAPSYELDHLHSNLGNLREPCAACFSFPSTPVQETYVDLLQFSQFGGVPSPLIRGVKPPSRWFADLRYSLATPLPHTYPSVGPDVLNSARVERAIQGQIEAGCPLTIHALRKKTRHFFAEMRASLSRFICKICGYVLFKVFRRLMTKLLVSPEQMKRLKEANASGIPLVYLPLHKSHLDYLMITWTAWHFGLPLPHIASGDNLNLSGLGWLLRATGAFFIRRRVDPSDTSGKDALYRAVLHSYIEQLLGRGLPIEFFLEGTRSRFGKSLIPKHGLISNVVEAYQQGTITDCYIVPVSYTYDDVAEGIFLDELMGIPKVRESVLGVFRGLLKGFRVGQQCGAVRMHFGAPVLLSNYISALSASLAVRTPSDALTRLPHSVSYRELVPWQEEHIARVDNRSLIRAIGYHIVYEAQSQVSVSLPSIVSTLLLCKFRKGVSTDVLAADIEWLCEAAVANGSDVVGWRNTESCGLKAFEYAMKYLHDAVDRHDDFVEPRRTHRFLMQLAYNKNALVPMFAIKSAIALAVVSNELREVSMYGLIDEVVQLCDWLHYEVIFAKPCTPLRDCIKNQVLEMCDHYNGLLTLKTNDDDDDEFFSKEQYGASSTVSIRNPQASLILIFLSNFLRPFVQSLYMVAARILEKGAEDKESVLIRTMCREFLADAHQLPFDALLEAINSDSFKNALSVLREKKVIGGDVTKLTVDEPERLRSLTGALSERLAVFKLE